MDVKAYNQNDETGLNPADIYLFKVYNGNSRTMFVVYSKLTIRKQE